MKWNDISHWIYVPESLALQIGMTHEGRMFGVPAWLADDPNDRDIFWGAPKVPLLTLWCIFADKCYELFSYTMPSDKYLKTPIYPTRKIGE